MCRTFVYLMFFALLLGLAVNVASGLEVKINFQRSSDTIPAGYLPDYGQTFGNRNNGYYYGWDTDITRLAHDRNNSSPDQRYDSNVDMQDPDSGTNYTWEIELPAGIYDIFLVCGDAYYDDHISNIDVEGTIIDDPDGRSQINEYNVTVTVIDGRLTIRPAPGAVKTSLVFIHITRVETFKAYGPDPKNGSIYPDTFAILTWTSGDAAVSHNVYFGDNFSNVNNGTGDTFKGNQTETSFTVGFPGSPYPDGLTPGTYYYWRIDEVNESNPGSPCRGDIWSFKTAPQTAYNPIPNDGATMVELNVTLNWTAGIGAKLHNIYLGIDKNAVENATTSSPECMAKNQNTVSYQPGPPKITIEKNKAYYWRIDEFDGSKWHEGDVWSFSTIPLIPITDPNLLCWWKFDEGLDTATTAFDSSGYDHHGVIHWTNLVTNGRIGEARDFYGSTGDYVVDEDAEDYLNGLSAITVCMWIKATVIGTDAGFIHTVYPHRNDDAVTMRYDVAGAWGYGTNVFKMGVRTYHSTEIDWKQRYESAAYVQSTEWQHVTMTWSTGQLIKFYINAREDAPTFYELPGPSGSTIAYSNMLKVGTGGYGSWNGLIDDVRIYNKVLTKEDISRVMIGESDHAWNPSPTDGSTPDMHRALPLSWSAGSMAVQHDVYFGTDENAVAGANTSDTTGIYRPRQAATSYTPPEGVEWGKGPYYWRIDEYNTDGTITTGRIWQFTVADFILVDDIEDYNNTYPDRVFNTWRDGYGYSIYDGDTWAGHYCGNGTGSTVGHEQTPYAEVGIVNSGGQSMPFYYDNSATGYNICDQLITQYYSEAKRSLAYPRDWTEQDVKALTLWFRGYAADFKEGPTGTYTMTASGADIWKTSDEFRYAYKRFTGAGSIVAKVLNVQFGNDQSKAGVMIRRTLDSSSPHAAVFIRAGGGCRFDYRPSPGDTTRNTTDPNTPEGVLIKPPYWVKLERDSSDNFNGYHSSDGVNWKAFSSNPVYVAMTGEIYIGLALTSHNANALCKAQFSDVKINGSVSPPVNVWTNEVIGGTAMQTNDPEPMYVAIANKTGSPAVVYHEDPNVVQIDTWTQWNIDLKDFTSKGINLADVNSIAVGLGTRNGTQAGGSGLMYFDDIRLYRSRCVPDKVTLSQSDLNSDCVVDLRDLQVMAGDWLTNGPDSDLNVDSMVDFKDYAVLADQWLEEQPDWPAL